MYVYLHNILLKLYLLTFIFIFLYCHIYTIKFVVDYVYFESQQQPQSALQQQQPQQQLQQQPFQIRRIEELNKTAGGNVEAKVMCFYRRRDLPAQLVALADKHQQHQQLSLTLSLSPGGSSSIKCGGKQTVAIKASSTTDKDVLAKENDTGRTMVKKEQNQVVEEEFIAGSKIEATEMTDTIKEEKDINMTAIVDSDSAVVKSAKSQLDENCSDNNDKSKYILYY